MFYIYIYIYLNPSTSQCRERAHAGGRAVKGGGEREIAITLSYFINIARVVFLNERRQPRAVTLAAPTSSSSSGSSSKSAANACHVCSRSLLVPFCFYSLSCKLNPEIAISLRDRNFLIPALMHLLNRYYSLEFLKKYFIIINFC